MKPEEEFREPEWTAELDRALKSLPLRSAPPSLIPRTLEAIRKEAARGKAAAGWLAWPLWARLVSAAAAIALLIGLGFALQPLVESVWASLAGPAQTFAAHAARLFHAVRNLGGAVESVPLLFLAGWGAALWLCAAATGSFLYRLLLSSVSMSDSKP